MTAFSPQHLDAYLPFEIKFVLSMEALEVRGSVKAGADWSNITLTAQIQNPQLRGPVGHGGRLPHPVQVNVAGQTSAFEIGLRRARTALHEGIARQMHRTGYPA